MTRSGYWLGRAGRLLVLLPGFALCDAWREPLRVEQESVAIESTGTPVLTSSDLCAQAIDELAERAALPGTPKLDLHRVEILGRARAVPLAFAREPAPSPSEDPRTLRLRAELSTSADPAVAIYQILRKTRGNTELRRQIFLREGYLYADEPQLALRLSQVLRFDHLFDDRQVEVRRGAERRLAERIDGKYYWVRDTTAIHAAQAAPEIREEANLLLFDQAWVAGAPEPPILHADLTQLRAQLHFDHLWIQALTAERWSVGLSSAGLETQALLRVEAGQAQLECESLADAPLARLASARAERAERKRLLAPILAATREIVERRLPFDEPRTEEGQQDGLLRIHFRKAFREGRQTYEFNGDRYFVFDGFGRPLLPEVCIDFITDALDWGTGGHWSWRGQGRTQVRGAIDFKSFGMENPRSVEQVAEFAAARPSWFDMVFLETEQRVKFVHRERFFQQLAKDRDLYQVGDIVFILGLRDDERFHYHSFFIQEVDPVAGTPTLLAANAGPPQLRTWEGEMSNAPLRSIVARLRLRTRLLADAAEQAELRPGVPLQPPDPIPAPAALPE